MTLKHVCIGLFVAILTGGVVELLFNLNFISIVVGFLVGAVVVIILIATARGEDPKQVAKEVVRAAREVVTESPYVAAERAAHEQLFRACTSFVMCGNEVSLCDTLKRTVEKIRTILPRAIEFAPDSETTFNILKLAREDLPRQIEAFVDLSTDDKNAVKEKFATQLNALLEKITRLGDFIDQGRKGQFDAESAFIDLKFN
jgi:hypothetical protein